MSFYGIKKSMLFNELKKSKINRCVIGFSGGVDSTVLAHLLYRHNLENSECAIQCKLVHVNHGLSKNAMDWEMHCRNFADELGFDFAVERVVVDRRGREGLEAAARTVRREALSKHLDTGVALLTGHHGDDLVENVLLALKRGSGLRGITSMSEEGVFDNGSPLFRPLLSMDKASIYEYAHQHELKWVEDESNSSSDYDRNFLRNEVIPLLKGRWGSFTKTTKNSIALCKEQLKICDTTIGDMYEMGAILEKRHKSMLPVQVLKERKREDPHLFNELIVYWLRDNGVFNYNKKLIDEIWRSVIMVSPDSSPRLLIGDGNAIRRYRDKIMIIPLTDEFELAPHPYSQEWLEGFLSEYGYRSHIGESETANLSKLPKGELGVIYELPDAKSFCCYTEGMPRVLTSKKGKFYKSLGIPLWRRKGTPIITLDGVPVYMLGGHWIRLKLD